MKKINALIIGLLFFLSCTKNTEEKHDNLKSTYVYFAYPNRTTAAVEKFVNQINYSFALDEEIGIKSKIIKIPIQITGLSSKHSRFFKYKISNQSQYDPASITISDPIIGAGKYVDTLYLTLNRDPKLADKAMSILLEIEENDEFKIGNLYNRQIEIIYSDVLDRPIWWKEWENYLGAFHKEVFQQWMQIYEFGSDPSPDIYGSSEGPFYYWNNMPNTSNSSWYPITFIYIEQLKQYFLNHEIYPNGDKSKERILLP